MQLKRFEAQTMPEALRNVRADLGERAVILETRRINGGLLGLRPARVQVLAGINQDSAPDLNANLAAVRALLRPPTDLRRADVLERLHEAGVESALALSVMDACPAGAIDAVIAAEMASRIPVGGAQGTGLPARIALVGPTGVGKTTTTAKLAARFALTKKKKVALLTIDTYRIGAVEQLRTYARVMGLPLEVVNSPEEMTGAVARHADKDVLLIDTVGRSPRRALQLAEIKTFLNAAAPTETHLVLAAPGGLNYLMDTAASFEVLDPTHLIITKLDEMPQWGAIASLTHRTGLPVSFITDGQEVPRNLVPANAEAIATHILGGME